MNIKEVFILKKYQKGLLSIFFMLSIILLTACADNNTNENAKDDKEKIVLGDSGWDSIRFHNGVAATIIEEGFGYPTEVTPGNEQTTFLGLQNGDIDVLTEVWFNGLQEEFTEAEEKGEVKQLSENFIGEGEGLFVPTYLIEGDEERGIEPEAPDLKSVEDLPKYWELFESPEKPDKGRIVGSPTTYEADEILQVKMETYGLDETYEYFRPGSDSALNTSLVEAYEAGKPWVGYNWGPTWVMGEYDMTLLEEDEYDEEVWDESKKTEFPNRPIIVGANQEFVDSGPEEVVDFLSNYETSAEITSNALAVMREQDIEPEEAANAWMKDNPDIWKEWIPEDVAEKVESAIND